MKILAIETSCDETAMAVVEVKNDKFNILKEIVSSQIKVHRPYGGVVPNLAKREHLKNLPIIYKEIEKELDSRFRGNDKKIDMIAVTVGPGLEPALWTGINFANDLSKELGVPLVGVNHLEGHIYSNWLSKKISLPAIVLVVSGGHTILLHMEEMKKWKKLGETRDDAVGEAFDKVAKMLGLPYPGGPEVEKLAAKGDPNAIDFPRPMIHAKNYDFSFSGLKTSVLYYLKELDSHIRGNDKTIKNVCASFQKAAIDVLTSKAMKAVEKFGAKSVLICGGVAANNALRNRLESEAKKVGLHFNVPEFKYNTDNAVMIAAAAHMGRNYPVEKALPNLNL